MTVDACVALTLCYLFSENTHFFPVAENAKIWFHCFVTDLTSYMQGRSLEDLYIWFPLSFSSDGLPHWFTLQCLCSKEQFLLCTAPSGVMNSSMLGLLFPLRYGILGSLHKETESRARKVVKINVSFVNTENHEKPLPFSVLLSKCTADLACCSFFLLHTNDPKKLFQM